MTARGRLDSPLGAAALALVALGAFVVLRLLVEAGSVAGFVVAGEIWTDPSAGLPLVPGTGYDGQFVWALAQDPWSDSRTTQTGVTMDLPAYRHQRIALPAAVWLLSQAGVPATAGLLLVNVAAVVATAAVAGVLLRRLGVHAAWGAAVALLPAEVMAVARDLNEPLAALGIVGGLALWQTRRWALAAVPLTVGVLARETVAVVVVGLALACLVQRQDVLRRWAVLAVPGVALVGWQWWVYATYDVLAPQEPPPGANVGTPLVDVLVSIPRGLGDISGGLNDVVLRHAWLVERVVLLVALVGLLVLLRRSTAALGWKLAFALTTALTLTSASWRADVQFWRVAGEACVVGLLVAAGLPQRRLFFLGALACSAVTAVLHAVAV